MDKNFMKSLEQTIKSELDLCIAAAQAHALYSAFVEAGFTEDQALKIVISAVNPNTK